MRKEGIQIGRIYGIPIFLHTSWFLIFGLIAFSFYSEFDAIQLNIPTSRLWGLGLMTSLLFFASLVFHEMAHSVIAKHYKIPVVSITLFVFGGVSPSGPTVANPSCLNTRRNGSTAVDPKAETTS